MSLIEEMQEHARTTTGHSLGMNETDLHGEGAAALGGFDLGRDQVCREKLPKSSSGNKHAGHDGAKIRRKREKDGMILKKNKKKFRRRHA